jgi:hypothetical protein
MVRKAPPKSTTHMVTSRLDARRPHQTDTWRKFAQEPQPLRLHQVTEGRLGPRFRPPSVDRRHPCLPQRHLTGAYEEGIAGMVTIIKALLLGSALMLLEGCTGYLTSYQTPCVEGHVCECVRYTTVNRSWLDCRDYGRVKSRAY